MKMVISLLLTFFVCDIYVLYEELVQKYTFNSGYTA